MSKKETKSAKVETAKPAATEKPVQPKWGTVEWAYAHPYFGEETTNKQRIRMRDHVCGHTKDLISITEVFEMLLGRMCKLGFSEVPETATAIHRITEIVHDITKVAYDQVSMLANTSVAADLTKSFLQAKECKCAKKPADKTEKKPAKK